MAGPEMVGSVSSPSTSTTPRKPTSIDDLPTELLAEIISFLDGPAPSEDRLRDQPIKGFLNSEVRDVKAASLVCKRWRATSLSILYRHVLWPLDRWDLLLAEQEEDPASAMPFVKFLRDNHLGGAVRSLTMIVGDSSLGFYSRRVREAGGSAVHTG